MLQYFPNFCFVFENVIMEKVQQTLVWQRENVRITAGSKNQP